MTDAHIPIGAGTDELREDLGGSLPETKQAIYFAGEGNAPVSVPSGVDTAGPWFRVSGGTEDILDLTDPTSPVVLADGLYIGTGTIVCDTDHPGKYMEVSAESDTEDWALGGNIFPVEITNHGSSVTGPVAVGVRVGFSEFLQAGQKIGWFVKHDVGSSVDFTFNFNLVYLACTGQAIV